MILACSILIGGCAKGDVEPTTAPSETSASAVVTETTEPANPFADDTSLHVRPDSNPNGDVVILMTGDMHSRVDKGFSLGGVYEVRYQLELKGDTVLLVDTGDAIQGAPIGYNTQGEAVINLMNKLGYDVAVPGVHEFHYGVDRFFELAKKANFEYISCNFVKEDKLALKPYVIKEVCGKKIAFVGVTTPKAITLVPSEYFQNSAGTFIYGFMQDENGDAIVRAIQDSVDKARSEGAEYVILMGHIGNEAVSAPWIYTNIVTRVRGCDAYFDGYSHDIKKEEYIDGEGKKLARISAGAGLRGIGWVRIAKDGTVTTGLHSWINDNISAVELFDIDNPMVRKVNEAMKDFPDKGFG